MNIELMYVLIMFAIAALVVLLYGVRVSLKGQAHFDRVDRQGGSFLLSKSVMEIGYWMFQPFARLLVFCHVSANQISWGSLIFAFISGCCLAFGHFGFGSGFATLSAMMDSLDGMVARMTGQSSEAGEVLDASVDRYAEFFFLGGLVIYYREVPAFLVLTLLALIGSFMVSYSTAKAEALQVSPPKGNMRRPERAFYLTLGAALSPITIPWLETYREYSIAVAHPMIIALCLVAVMANFSALERLWAVAKVVRAREKSEASAQKRSDSPLLLEEESEESRGFQNNLRF